MNVAGLSRDAAVGRTTCQNYFEILEDTLVGYLVPAWKPRAKVRERGKPKFYFFDPGIVNGIAGDFELYDRREGTRGNLLETLVLNELRAAIEYQNLDAEIFYWKGSSEREVDFIVRNGGKDIGIEVKCSSRWRREYGKALSELPLDARYTVYLGDTRQKHKDISILPFMDFCRTVQGGSLWGNFGRAG